MPTAIRGRKAPLAAAVLGGAFLAALVGGTAVAGPAAAMEDPRRPDVAVTHGPSCGPAAVRVQVTNGSRAGSVALVFDGHAVQQQADLGAGQAVELGSGDVDWGVTVDVSVTAVLADGSALPPVELGTYTRPSKADCDAVAAPTTDVVPVPDVVPPPVPAAPTTASSSSGSVAPGGVVRVRGTGFAPGEQVTVRMAGRSAPLATVAAGRDGSVDAAVQIPRGADPGSTDVQLVGADSAATAGVALQVAALTAPETAGDAGSSPVALMAGSTLLVAAGGLGLSALRRPRDGAQGADLRR